MDISQKRPIITRSCIKFKSSRLLISLAPYHISAATSFTHFWINRPIGSYKIKQCRAYLPSSNLYLYIKKKRKNGGGTYNVWSHSPSWGDLGTVGVQVDQDTCPHNQLDITGNISVQLY